MNSTGGGSARDASAVAAAAALMSASSSSGRLSPAGHAPGSLAAQAAAQLRCELFAAVDVASGAPCVLKGYHLRPTADGGWRELEARRQRATHFLSWRVTD